MVLLRYALHLPDKEIAATLGVSLATVKTTMSSALETLQEEIR